eukprot:Sspe_Gene.95190::Locus_67501_Transcript_1_1_Confidence_1.000_Length_764::g.95190::m.95190
MPPRRDFSTTRYWKPRTEMSMWDHRREKCDTGNPDEDEAFDDTEPEGESSSRPRSLSSVRALSGGGIALFLALDRLRFERFRMTATAFMKGTQRDPGGASSPELWREVGRAKVRVMVTVEGSPSYRCTESMEALPP